LWRGITHHDSRRGGAEAIDLRVRNARTLASDSPLAYKTYATGNYVVNGTWPPANGYF
jgi:hypothetical protein